MKTSHPAAALRGRILFVAAVFLLLALASRGHFGVVEVSALRLRAEPNLTAPALALITEVEGVDEETLNFDDVYEGSDIPEDELLPEPLVAHVDTDGTPLNVRSGPGTTYTTVGKVSSGSFLTVLSKQNGWCSVVYQDRTAYISADYVRLMTQADYDNFKAGSGYRGEQLVAHAQNYLGRPYVYGGNGPNSFDCSGFTKYVYAQFGYTLNRTATDQLDNGHSVEKGELAAGDLVFFRSAGTVKPVSHVGLYIGGGSFIHASTNNYQIRIDTLDSGYYSGIYVGARRVV